MLCRDIMHFGRKVPVFGGTSSWGRVRQMNMTLFVKMWAEKW